MDSSLAISAQSLGKFYHLGQTVNLRRTLREALAALPGAVGRGVKRRAAGGANGDAEDEIIWALRDVSFDVPQGQVLGIIGPNGAGKSTLLKILSRITAPSTGRARVRGRLASLLEVGTGFHPELTGRENIYLNGAILGMRRTEIIERFDEIVAFSEVGRFLETPVKRYSSGMRVRLAFAVAAHLEPEILLIDEVLAVGDAAFQRKCLGKMTDLSTGGRTVLFVSHNMNAVNRLCSRVLLLDGGRIVRDGPAQDVVRSYLGSAIGETAGEAEFPDDPNKDYQILEAGLYRRDGARIVDHIESDESFSVRLKIKTRVPLPSGYATLLFRNQVGEIIMLAENRDHPESVQFEEPFDGTVQIDFPAPMLVPDRYLITVALARPPRGDVETHENALSLEVVDTKGVRSKRPGYIFAPSRWSRIPEK